MYLLCPKTYFIVLLHSFIILHSLCGHSCSQKFTGASGLSSVFIESKTQRRDEDMSPGLCKHMGGSINGGPPKSSFLMGFSTVNHPFWATSIDGNPHMHRLTLPGLVLKRLEPQLRSMAQLGKAEFDLQRMTSEN